jgi:hypothetical protein
MRLKKLLFLMLIPGIALMTYSCNLEYFDDAELEDFTFNPSLAVSIGEITYTVSDLFEQLNDPSVAIVPNSEDVVTLLYVEQLSSQDASEFLIIQNQGFTGSVNAGINSPNSPASATINVNETFTYDLTLESGQEFDSLYFAGGNFEIDITSDIQSSVTFNLTINSLINKNTGLPLIATGTVSPSNTTFTTSSPLTDYKGIFINDGLGGISSNKVLIEVDYAIAIEIGDNLNSTDALDFEVNFSQPDFEQVFGFIGQDQLDLSSQTIDLDFFSSFDEGIIRFADPKFTFNFDNKFGFPIGIDFQNVSATDAGGASLALTGLVTESVQVINAPTIDQLGESVRSEVTLEVANSNIDELMSSKPTSMTFDVVAETNPVTGPVQYNHLGSDNFLDVDIEVEIPLHIGLDNLTAEESMNFSNIENLDQVESIVLRIIIDNGMPMGGDVEVVFMNGSNPVYTISDRSLFISAPVGNDGRVSASAESIVDIEIDQTGIEAISEATQVLLRVTLSTTDVGDGVNVKLYDDYQMDVKLAMQAKLNLSSGN